MKAPPRPETQQHFPLFRHELPERVGGCLRRDQCRDCGKIRKYGPFCTESARVPCRSLAVDLRSSGATSGGAGRREMGHEGVGRRKRTREQEPLRRVALAGTPPDRLRLLLHAFRDRRPRPCASAAVACTMAAARSGIA